MKFQRLTKNTLMAFILAVFTYSVALPAFFPPSIEAQTTVEDARSLRKRIRAKQRSVRRMLRRSQAAESSAASTEQVLPLIAAVCGNDFVCTDGNGPVTVSDPNNCDDCTGTGAGSCTSCCNGMINNSSRQSTCRQTVCGEQA